MHGVVIYVEHRIGCISIRDHRGEITIAEMLGAYDAEKEHVIIGNLHSLGSAVWLNQTTNKNMHVMVEYIGLTERQAIAKIQKHRR